MKRLIGLPVLLSKTERESLFILSAAAAVGPN